MDYLLQKNVSTVWSRDDGKDKILLAGSYQFDPVSSPAVKGQRWMKESDGFTVVAISKI